MLGIGPDPVSLSLSEAVTARDLHGSAIFTNPANLSYNNRYVANASHTFWLDNSSNSHISLLIPSENGAFGLGVLTSSIRDIDARTNPGEPSGTFDVVYYAFAGSYSRDLKFVHLGVTAMYLYEQLYQLSASGYAINVGITRSFLSDRLRIGSTALNLGQMDYLAETRSPLPSIWKTGFWSEILQFSTIGSSEIPLIAALTTDFNYPLNDEGASDGASSQIDPWVSAGLEITISDIISIRGGYRSGESKRRFSSGVGVQFGNAVFNYAFVPFETGFGTTHAMSLSYFF